ncbi:MAG: DNA-binding protein [Candidatus Baldrarchaeota archaeon]|nr:DNA-binding protein [Candidatus Baldrarchaeota archaeon]
MDPELQRIMRKKMLELMKKMEEEKKKEEQRKKIEQQKMAIMQAVLMPDAYKYFLELKKNKPTVARKIEDVIIYLFINRRLVTKVDLIDIKRLERRIEGREPVIMIKRRGEDEIKTLSEALKSDENKSD